MDRRRMPTPMLSRFTLFGGRRRTGGRRDGEQDGVFVDVHGWVLFSAVLAIVGLNFLDAWFTIFFLSLGGQELNPVIDWVLGKGTWAFIAVKSVGIGVCVAVLTITKNFRIARAGLISVLGGYSALLLWHLHLLRQVP